MSRSNPQGNAPNPAVRWFEWNAEHGIVRYYDKDAKANVEVPLPFTFLLLDEVASVRGWHEASKSGIYSNEVRDTRTDLMVVKSFKGGTLAEGFYKGIKDRVNSLGGRFVANCYIAVKHNGGLSIASMRFKGAALGSWMEFRKEHRSDLLEKAVVIADSTEAKKGRTVYRTPNFALKDVSAETNAIAVDLDKELQAWLESYFSRRTTDQSEPSTPETDDSDESDDSVHTEPLTDSDIPF